MRQFVLRSKHGLELQWVEDGVLVYDGSATCNSHYDRTKRRQKAIHGVKSRRHRRGGG